MTTAKLTQGRQFRHEGGSNEAVVLSVVVTRQRLALSISSFVLPYRQTGQANLNLERHLVLFSARPPYCNVLSVIEHTRAE